MIAERAKVVSLQRISLEEIKKYLREYDGPEIHIMEVCGSHTGAIAKNGIPGMLSPGIHLISGPGCPVCVTPSAYIDKLIEISMRPQHCVVTFGDLLRVPGSERSLSQARGRGARVVMVYSPMDIFALAEAEPETTFVFAAIGFETTTPVYALMVQQILEDHVSNVQLLTAIKTMPEAIDWLCGQGRSEEMDDPANAGDQMEKPEAGEKVKSADPEINLIEESEKQAAGVQAFLAPGHVAVVTGSRAFVPLAEKYNVPFSVSGFSGEEILLALYGIARLYKSAQREQERIEIQRREGESKACESTEIRETTEFQEKRQSKVPQLFQKKSFPRGLGRVMNFYPSVVTENGNVTAQNLIDQYFEKTDAVWRGMGKIPGSGKVLKPEYAALDAGSRGLDEDRKINEACCCDKVLTGRMRPTQCPLFGKGCSPLRPQGACMVSTEGNCYSYYVNHRE